MAKFLTMDDVDFKGKVTLVRVDLNSAIDPETKKILDDTRIRVHGETTIKELSDKQAKTVVLAHQGRPGSKDFISLKEHSKILGEIIDKKVKYVDDLYGDTAKNAIRELKDGEIIILKNVRTFPDERKKSTAEEHSKSEFIQGLYPLADLFVSDAFAAAHRAHASIIGFTPLLPSVAGRIMERELKALGRVLENPEKPCVFIFGGAKADDSLMISQYVLTNNIADYILPGGVIGHLFLAAKGIDLGKPNMDFLEKQEAMPLIPGIQELMKTYPDKIKVPVDLAAEVDKKRKEVTVDDLPIENPIFDIGEKTSEEYVKIIGKAKTIVLSGPVGVFENKEFMLGTKNVFNAVAESEGFSLVGGGHTIAATKKLNLADKISYISTAGGALIEFLMGEALPGVVALEQAATKS